MSANIAGLAAPAAQRPISVASSSSSSSNNNQFYDDMAYLDQVVEAEKAKKPRMKWGARRKAESSTKSGPKSKPPAVVSKVNPKRSLASINSRDADHPLAFIPYRPPSSTHTPYPAMSTAHSSQISFTSTSRPVSPSPSLAPGSTTLFPPGPVVTLSSDSEPEGPSLFDDLASLDTATASSIPKAKSKSKKKERKTGNLNAGMSKLKLLKSSASLGRSSRSSDTASTARASLSPSGSSGSSFTFTRSRSRSSFSSRSTNTMTSLTTVTTSAHTAGSDPTTRLKPKTSPPQLSLPTVEVAPQLPPMAFLGTGASTTTSTSHTRPSVSPQRAPAQLPDPAPRTPNLSPSRPAPAPPVLDPPRPEPLTLTTALHYSSAATHSPPPFSSYRPASPPSHPAYETSSPPLVSSYDISPTTATSNRTPDPRRYSNGWYNAGPQRRASLAGRKGSAASVDRQGSVGSLALPGEYRRPSRGSVAESPCLSIIGNFPTPPDMQLDGNKQLGPGSADRLVAQLAAVAEHESRGHPRESCEAFLDEYMAFVSTPSPPEHVRSSSQLLVHERDNREHSLASECTTASPTLLTPEPGASTLTAPWERQAIFECEAGGNGLAVENESARPESIMLPPNDESSEQGSLSVKPRFEHYEPTDLVDPLAPNPLVIDVPSSSPPSTSFSPPRGSEPPVRRQTFGQLPTLPGMPLEKSFARSTRLDSAASAQSFTSELSSGGVNAKRAYRKDSAASGLSSGSLYSTAASRVGRKDSGTSVVSPGVSPTITMFPGVPDTPPLNIWPREGNASRSTSGPGRVRTAGGTIAPLNIARTRTVSNASSDARGGYTYSTSYDRDTTETLPRFNMSGHDLTRLRTNSGASRLAPPRPRRRSSATTPSSASSGGNSAGPTPPGSTPHTPGTTSSAHVYAHPLPSMHSPSFGQLTSPGQMEVQTVPAHTSYTQYGQSYNTSHYQYTPSYAPSSYMPPSSIASGGHSHTSSSSSVPSSGWYSSHGPTSPRSPPRRPSLPIEMRETSANAGQSSSGTRSPPGAMSPRIRGTPF